MTDWPPSGTVKITKAGWYIKAIFIIALLSATPTYAASIEARGVFVRISPHEQCWRRPSYSICKRYEAARVAAKSSSKPVKFEAQGVTYIIHPDGYSEIIY